MARLAGVPRAVLSRADELVDELIDTDIAQRAREIASYAAVGMQTRKRVPRQDDVDVNQMSLFETVKDEDVLTEIREMNLSMMTPLDAINTLFRIQSKLNNFEE